MLFKLKKKTVYHESGQTLEQVTQERCGAPITGDLQNPTE